MRILRIAKVDEFETTSQVAKVGEAALPIVSDLVKKVTPAITVEVTLLQVIPTSQWLAAGEGAAPVPYTEAEMKQIRKLVLRYLKEAGKWTPEREALNQKRLAHQAKLKEIWDAAMDEALSKKMRMKTFPEFWMKKRAEAGF